MSNIVYVKANVTANASSLGPIRKIMKIKELTDKELEMIEDALYFFSATYEDDKEAFSLLRKIQYIRYERSS